MLKRLYSCLFLVDVAAALGRTKAAVKTKAQRMGLRVDNDPKRSWTAAELEHVREHYLQRPTRVLARELGRTAASVFFAAKKLGLTQARVPQRPGLAELVRRRNAEGWSDAEIAKTWGCSREYICEYRTKLGLPAAGRSEHYRRLVAARTAAQIARAGLPSIGHLRVEAYRKRARAAGWPEDLRPRAVQILNALWERGPMTRREIADAIGMPWKGARKSLVSNDPEGTYLQALINRGLVVSLGRVVKGRGRGRSVHAYALPLWIERGATG